MDKIIVYFVSENLITWKSNTCDAIWENLPYVTKGNFAEIQKVVLKLLCFFFIIRNFGYRYQRETKIKRFEQEEIYSFHINTKISKCQIFTMWWVSHIASHIYKALRLSLPVIKVQKV